MGLSLRFWDADSGDADTGSSSISFKEKSHSRFGRELQLPIERFIDISLERPQAWVQGSGIWTWVPTACRAHHWYKPGKTPSLHVSQWDLNLGLNCTTCWQYIIPILYSHWDMASLQQTTTTRTEESKHNISSALVDPGNCTSRKKLKHSKALFDFSLKTCLIIRIWVPDKVELFIANRSESLFSIRVSSQDVKQIWIKCPEANRIFTPLHNCHFRLGDLCSQCLPVHLGYLIFNSYSLPVRC